MTRSADNPLRVIYGGIARKAGLSEPGGVGPTENLARLLNFTQRRIAPDETGVGDGCPRKRGEGRVTKRNGWNSRTRGNGRNRALLRWIVGGALFVHASAYGATPKETDSKKSKTTSSSTPSEAEIEKARAAFKRGNELLEANSFAEASREFSQALAIKKTPGLYYHLGVALHRAGRLVEARAAFSAASSFEGANAQADVTEALPAALEALERDTPKVVLTNVPENASIELDGVPVSDRDFSLDPGGHRIRASAPGHVSREISFDVALAERRIVELELLPLRRENPRESIAETREESSSARTAFIWSSAAFAVVGGGVGIAGLALGASETAKSEAASRAIEREVGSGSSTCVNPDPNLVSECDALGKALTGRETASTLAIVGFSAAGVGVLGALGAVYLWPKSEVRVEADVALGRATFRIGGRF